MNDLVEFLKARLDEDEAAAQAAPGNEWTSRTQDSVASASVYDEQWVLLYPQHYDHDEPLSNQPGATGPMYIERSRDELAAHIARHDPARVLADVEAKRRILDLHKLEVQKLPSSPFDPETGERNEPEFEVMCEVCGWASDDPTSGCETLRLLALPFDQHPDYDEEYFEENC